MSNIQPAYTKILAQDDSTSVTGHYLGGNLENNEYIAVRQVGYLGLTSVTTCLACASNWRGFSTNALLVGDKTGGKYLLVSITDTAIDRERVVVYKLVPQNNTWVHLTIADWFSDFKGVYRFKKWVLGVNDGSRLVATGQFDAMDSSIHIEDYPRTVVVDLENLDSESTDQTNSQTTGEATKPPIEVKMVNEQFNEDSTMQADKSKSTNGKYTLLEFQKYTDRFKVSEDRKIAVTVKREFSDKTNLLTRAHVFIYGQSIVHGDGYNELQVFDFELNSRSPYSLDLNEDGSIIAIGLPSQKDGYGEVRIWWRSPGSVGWKTWGAICTDGPRSFGKVVRFTPPGLLQVEHDRGYSYFDALSGRAVMQPSDNTKEQPASDEFLGALKKKKDETVKLHQEGENMINLQRVRNSELEQEIDLLNNLIELYSKKKP